MFFKWLSRNLKPCGGAPASVTFTCLGGKSRSRSATGLETASSWDEVRDSNVSSGTTSSSALKFILRCRLRKWLPPLIVNAKRASTFNDVPEFENLSWHDTLMSPDLFCRSCKVSIIYYMQVFDPYFTIKVSSHERFSLSLKELTGLDNPFSYCRSPNKLNMRGGISSPSISWWVAIAFSQRWRNLQSRMPYFCSGYQRKSWLETTPLTDKSIMNNLPIWRQSLQGIGIMPSVPLHVCVCICASYPFTM